jgi:hypothetical protein
LIPIATCYRRIVLALAFAGSLVAPALAQRTTSSGIDEPAARATHHANTACTGSTRISASHVAAGCTDDTPVIASRCAPACSTGTRHAELRVGPAGAPLPLPSSDHRGEKREHGKTATGVALKTQRPSTQRSKGNIRNAPATPGMGTLLRMGASAGREISYLLDMTPIEPLEHISGRAPPPATALTPLAPASPPCASPITAIAVRPGPTTLRPGSLPTPQRPVRCSRTPAMACAQRNPYRAEPRPDTQYDARSRDTRLEGALS